MFSANNLNPLLNAMFSKELVTFIEAEQLWNYKQWEALTASPFPIILSPSDQPPPLIPPVTQPKLFEDEAQQDV